MIQQVEFDIDIPDEYVNLSLSDLEDMEVIEEGYTADLLINDGRFKVWLERVGVDDGMPYDNAVTIETVIEGKWIEVLMYEAL